MPSSASSQQRWFALLTALLAVATVVLGGIGLYRTSAFATALAEDGPWAAGTALLFDAASLLAFSQPGDPPTNVWFGTARLTALGFALTAASTLVLSLSRSARVRLSLWQIRKHSTSHPDAAHTVVVGTGPLARRLVRDVSTPPLSRQVIAAPVEGAADGADANAAVTLPGDPCDADVRDRWHVHVAKEVFVATADDALNLDVAGDVLRDARSGRWSRSLGRALECYVNVGDPAYAHLLRTHDLFQAPDDPVHFHVFNVRERAARELLLDPDHGLATRYMPPPEGVAHYVVVGFGAAGRAVALESARLAHFAGQRRLRMTIVDDFHDDDAATPPVGEARRQFLARYPAFCPAHADFDLLRHARCSDPDKDAWTYRRYHPKCHRACAPDPAVEYVVNAEFVDLPAEDPDLVGSLLDRFAAPGDRPVHPAIVVCFDDDGRSFRTAHRIKELLTPEVKASDVSIPIFVHLPTEEGLAELIESDPADPIPLFAFGRRDRVATHAQITQPTVKAVARRLHASYRNTFNPNAAPWDKLSHSFRASNEDAAAHGVVKLRTAGYRWRVFDTADGASEQGLPASDLELGGRETLARVEHNRFLAERLLAGWRYAPVDAYVDALADETYEPVSAERRERVRQTMAERKQRPSLVPFDALPDEDKPKDAGQIDALLDALCDLDVRLEPLGARPE